MIPVLSRTVLQRSCLATLRKIHTNVYPMAHSKFEYVKSFEEEGQLDPQHWIIIRLRLKNVEELYDLHELEQPNDCSLTSLLQAAVDVVMQDFKEIVLCYSFSQEFNFVFAKNTTLYRRRGPKLLTNVCSLLSSAFVHKWPYYIQSSALIFPPVIDGAVHLLPDDQSLRDYMTKQQNVCHHQNLYKTAFWGLVTKRGMLPGEATETLKGANEGTLNELLFTRCNTNYNKEEDVFKKGSIALRKKVQKTVTAQNGSIIQRSQSTVTVMHADLTKDSFWSDVLVLDQPTELNAKLNYLKHFEKKETLLPHTWMVVRIDGKAFHNFSEKHYFKKPNDLRSIELMNKAAFSVMKEFPDIIFSYGQSDEYSFVIHRYSKMCDRQGGRIISSIVSLFAGVYVYHWQSMFEDVKLHYCPAFDARVVLYPNNSCLRDYISWRQADCHINNMYNTCFWTLVQQGQCSRQNAEEILCGTFSKDKRSILINRFNQNYDDEDAIFRKGTVMYQKMVSEESGRSRGELPENNQAEEGCRGIVVGHFDVIKDEFWRERPWLLGEERNATTLDDFD
ncbi:tRNA(His) guanylyltransferase 2-like [Portunus trituberculatus]|nr:tRNA(His) guanylyltransferase 2-like [Portunus trituberculatus]XP_045102041.1 tRNA(His) guanylyltransferase 2-like [Portunus trituberculatus]XP_045102042.1 tRNA(His) guanylyltransferase 2-like [Portunus trituberculatus]